MKIGLAIGRNTHTIVYVEGETVRTCFIANSGLGADKLITFLRKNASKEIVIAGNRRWAIPFARLLASQTIAVCYLNRKTKNGMRGKQPDTAAFLGNALIHGVRHYPFFELRGAEEVRWREEHSWVRAAHEYQRTANHVREWKHRIYNSMVILFPEAVRAETLTKRVGEKLIALPVPYPQPPELFTKKMRAVLENPDPVILNKSHHVPAEVRAAARHSVGRFITAQERRLETKNLNFAVDQYERFLREKEEKMQSLRDAVTECKNLQPVLKDFGDGDLIVVVLALIGWKRWRKWRELRRYCGMDVSVADAKGNARISRVRPQIRQYCFLLATMTRRGKEIVTQNVPPDATHKNVRKIRAILKYLLNNYLRESIGGADVPNNGFVCVVDSDGDVQR